MKEITFYITEEDLDRLFAIKELQGKHRLTGNDFARELLENELKRLFPQKPKYNEDGELENRNCYRG